VFKKREAQTMLKQIPYGISNFKYLIESNMYYVDKTKYIEKLEQKVSYQFFIRPRRFGKSLFLTMLEAYYDIYEKEHFQQYFGDLYIGKNPTADANKYLILSMSFADVISDQGKDKLIESFDNIVSREVTSCIEKYSEILNRKQLPESDKKATFALGFLKSIAKPVNAKILILIDEYDNFANNMMNNNQTLYEELTHQDGYVKTFYKGIKEGTADGVIARAFITGVSPIMLDDLTSGANIFEVISNDEDLNSIMGFTDDDLTNIIGYYDLGKKVDEKNLREILKNYCNGYKFNKEAIDTLYNTDMVLYILKSIISTGKYPENLIDDNVKTDYTRLRKIAEFFASKDELNGIIEAGTIGPVEIKSRFNLESLQDDYDKETNLWSLLYYIGMLTIDRPFENKVMLKIPNYAIKQLYWDYMSKTYQVTKNTRYSELIQAMHSMRMAGDTTNIMQIYEKVMNNLSTKDLTHFNEASCKSIFITLVFTDGLYLIESERESSGGYADLYIKENYLYKEHVKYRYMMEFKHIKAGELKGDLNGLSKDDVLKQNTSIIDQYKSDARNQLDKYMQDFNVLHDSDRILKKYTVVVLGRKYIVVNEV
jgi:hypothetical protein